MAQRDAERAAMARAVDLAARGLGRTSPNPVVGCVVLDAAGDVAGEGFHERYGGPHAEVVALRAAGERARGGTALVTLEPCDHSGKTGPCTGALLGAGVARVVYAVADPFAPASGGGAHLAAEGVEVEVGLLADAAERVNEAWLHLVRAGRPHVTWKYAASLDGRVAARDGSSRWITGEAARADVHRLRAECDAVVAGIGTVLADDPQLTVRDADGMPAGRQPLRVVVDTEGRTPADARVRDGAAATWVATAAEVPRAPGGGLDLAALLDALRQRGVVSVLLEGGPTLAGAFADAGLVDRVVGYVAPALVGGPPAFAVLGGTGATTIAEARRLRLDDVTVVGGDVRLTARPLPAVPTDPAPAAPPASQEA